MHTPRTLGMLSGLFIVLGFALPVYANTTSISSDPSYAAAPFSYYCQPYVRSFEDDRHYLPAAPNPICLYSVPNTIVGSRDIALYKGTLGNATLMLGDQVPGGSTLVQENNTNFGSPVQDQDYFAVIYDDSIGAALNTYLTTGGPVPPEAIENQNYYVLPWKWGSKPTSEFEPVIIVPDILNSWVTDSGVVLDPIFHTYQNLIDTLAANGYVLNQTLFTLPYNWEDSNATTATLLQNKIQAIRAQCGCSRVDIIADGAGGLAASQYVQSGGYQNDVDQIIYLGTPFYGVPSAYLALEGGKISFGSPLSDGLAQTFLGAEAQQGGFSSIFDYIQNKPATAFKELVPADINYLTDPSFTSYIYPTHYPRNTFLENLINNFVAQVQAKVQINTALADDQQNQTPLLYAVVPSATPPLWPDGQPTVTTPDSGDGMVPRLSIESLVGAADQEFSVTHRALPTAAEAFVFKFLNNRNPATLVNNSYPVSCVLFITTSSQTDLQITDPSAHRLGKDFSGSGTFAEIPNSLYSGPNAPVEYGIVANPVNGTYQIRTQGNTNGSFSVNASDVCGTGIVSTSTPSTTAAGQLLGFSLNVSTSTQTLSIQQVDTTPPAVVIINPVQNSSHLQSATTTLAAAITDASPIASTIFKINGSAVSPANFAYATLPLGTSTLVVSATDIFGNTGYATSSFAVVAPPPPPPPAGSGACAVSLNANAKGAITLTGSTSIKGTNCGVQVNSNASGAVNVSGSTKITSTKNCFVGTVSKSGSASVSPAPLASCGAQADPFANYAKPAVGACTQTNLSIAAASKATLNPGVYCGGITVDGSAQVTLNPGIYIIKNGDLSIAGAGQVKGTGVSFFMTGAGAGLTLAGSGSLNITAPTSGTMAGFAIFLDPSNTGGTPLGATTLSGSATLTATGVVYLPRQQFNVAGSAHNAATSFFAVVADTFNISGSPTITLTIPTGSSAVPVPAGL